MRIEVLTVSDCPNGPALEVRLAEVLAGRTDAQVVCRVIGTQSGAERRGMHGSPTLLVDGRDPFAAPGSAASVSCRLYPGADGRAQGAPSVAQLRRVLGEPSDCCADPAPGASSVGRAGRGRLAPVEGGWRAVQQAVLRGFAQSGSAPGTAVLEAAAAPFGVSAAQVLEELAAEDFLTVDVDGRIVAAYPFSAVSTGIEVTLPGGVRVASMCAIDALGIPAMLDADAVIDASDPVSGDAVRVRCTGGAAAWEPASAVVFYGARPEAGPAAAVCCGYLRFFATRATAQAFAAAHPEADGTVLDQDAAQRLGAEIFGALLTASD
jgi:hypothetical protein